MLEERLEGDTDIQYVWSPVYIDAMVLRDRDTDGNGSLDERFYVQQDGNYNVTAIVDSSGDVQERYIEDAYGTVTFLDEDWSTLAGSAFAWVYLHQGGRLQLVTGLYHFRNRELSATLGRWAQRDPAGFLGGLNAYVLVDNNPLSVTDPLGLWAIQRDGGARGAATTERGDTIRKLADTIGLNTHEFGKWLDEPGRLVTLANGNEVPLLAVSPDQELAPCQSFLIPNTVMALWFGDFGALGMWTVGFVDDIEYLQERGFSTMVDEFPHRNTVYHLAKQLTIRKELHGLYVWGHGTTSGFGSRGNTDVSYLVLSNKLQYRLGLAILNVCDGLSGRGLVSSSPGARFFGIAGTLWINNSADISNVIKPGEQGTKPQGYSPEPGCFVNPRCFGVPW